MYGYVRTTNGAGGQRFVHAMNIAGKCALTQVSLTVYLKFCEIQSLVRLVCIKEVRVHDKGKSFPYGKIKVIQIKTSPVSLISDINLTC